MWIDDPVARAGIVAGVTAAAIIVTGISVLRRRPPRSRVWGLLMVAVAASAAATVLDAIGRHPAAGTTGAALIPGYVGYALLVLALGATARPGRGRIDLGATLDATILGLLAALVVWRSGLSDAVGRTTVSGPELVVAVAAPAVGIALLVVLLRRAFGTGRMSPASGLVLAAAACTTAAATAAGVTILRGGEAAVAVALLIGTTTLVTAAAIHPEMDRITGPVEVTRGGYGPVRIALSSLALLAAPVVLLVEHGRITSTNAPLVATASAISIFVLIRLIGLAGEMERVRQRERTRDQRFESLVRYSSDLIAVLDEDFRVTYLSPASEQVMGRTPGSLLGLSALTGFHRDDVDRVRGLLRELTPDATSELTLVRLMHASGTWRWIEARAVNLIDDPTVQGIVVNCRDVTQRVMARAVIDDSVARQSAIAHLGRIALAAPDARSLTKRAASLIRSTLEASSCEIVLFDDDRVVDAVVATPGAIDVPDVADHPDAAILAACLGHDEPIQFTDPDPGGPLHTAGPLRFTDLERTSDRPETIVPEDVPSPPPQVLAVHVADRDRVMGVVLARSGTSRAFRDDEAAFLDTMAGTLGLALSRRTTEAEAHHQALHDALTGLPNRTLFVDRLAQALSRIRRSDQRVAVLFLDIDHFKVVNDSLGHSVGDRILVEVAERLGTLVRPGDTVARFGGDEFTVLLDPLGPHDRAEVVAERIREEVSRATRVGAAELQPTVSIGVAITGSRSANAETLLRDADAAMYQAKEKGRDNVAVFDDTMRDRVIHRLQTEMDLPRAIARNELMMRYQPIVRIADGATVGREALVRWRHPDFGEIPPDQFIPVAELSGLIGDLDRWVMHTVMDQCARTDRATHGRGPWYALNISGRTVAGNELVDEVASTLDRTGAPPDKIRLEITESALMHDMDHSIAVLEQLRELGVGISVDDFGTGYSSLAYLRRLPATALKIDGSFIATIERDHRDRAIVESVVKLAATLEMDAVAEGVETRAQLDILGDMDCPMAQGFLLGRPEETPTVTHNRPVSGPTLTVADGSRYAEGA